MAENLIAEHRVSQTRFESFQQLLVPAGAPGVPAAALSLKVVEDAVVEYQKRVRVKIASKLEPAYELPENKNNQIRLDPGKDLCTILNLTLFGRVYERAGKELGIAPFRHFEITGPSDEDTNALLQDGLSTSDPLRRGEFMDAALRAIAWYRQNEQEVLYPTWAAEWDSIEPYLGAKAPSRWLQSVGVGKDNAIWVAVLRYRLPSAVGMYRPTQLDAGWYAYHFPSPPQAELEKGGFTMDLRDAPPDPRQGLVSEYLHRQIDFEIGDWTRAGSLVGFVSPDVGLRMRLSGLRSRHLDHLDEVYPGVRAAWPRVDEI